MISNNFFRPFLSSCYYLLSRQITYVHDNVTAIVIPSMLSGEPDKRDNRIWKGKGLSQDGIGHLGVVCHCESVGPPLVAILVMEDHFFVAMEEVHLDEVDDGDYLLFE